MLFIGLVVLTMACLSYGQLWVRRVGLICVGLTTFAAGFLPTANLWVGLSFVSGWLFLPWVEILLRVRKLRLPLRKELRHVPPPTRDAFPELNELSDDVEAAGFEHVADLGWEMEGYRQFFRLFAHEGRREEAAITYVEQKHLGFHFVSVTSRQAEGAVFTTWNCPVSSSLKTPPSVRLHRASGEMDFVGVQADHDKFLERSGLVRSALSPVDPEKVRGAVERDMETQMQHNISEGLLRPAEQGHGRYSWRGMFYLWFQLLRDIFRFI
jgi:hypothetical protein